MKKDSRQLVNFVGVIFGLVIGRLIGSLFFEGSSFFSGLVPALLGALITYTVLQLIRKVKN